MKLRRPTVDDRPVEETPFVTRVTSGEVAAPSTEVGRTGSRLGEILVRRAVPEAVIIEALLQQTATGQRVGEVLLEVGALSEDVLAAALAEQSGLELVDLARLVVTDEALARLPESVARSCSAIPLTIADGLLRVAVADPSPETLGRLRAAITDDLHLSVAPVSTVRGLIDREYRALVGVDEHLEAFELAGGLKTVRQLAEATTGLDEAPVVRIVQLLLTQALRDRASDIHLESQEDRIRVRYRIDGVLHEVLSLPVHVGPALISRIKIMAALNIVERRRSQDGQIATEIDGRALDIRVATAATISGEKVVLRLLDRSRPLYRLRDLGMPEELAENYERVAASPFGMVVLTGPTGSGKTTSLYATLTAISSSDINVVTIEDPVEYVLSSVNQIQVNEPAGITFAASLRATMRQDPDVILVGEIRDAETAAIAVRAALTGHLVLTSLHATDAASAVHRFLDMGVEPFLVSSALLSVVAQRLVRRVCQHCRTEDRPTAAELAFYRGAGGTRSDGFSRGAGCAVCATTGFQDRIGVYEVMTVSERIRELTVERASREAIREAAVADGMRTLRQEGIRLVDEGVTTISEVVRSIYLI
jgi:type IV pilus assembly protein PilB